jgi:Gas vesicle synthesis protein GvpL/GvpF
MAERALLWAYGVVPASQPTPGVRGIEGADVSVVTSGDLAVLVSSVPGERFGAEQLQDRLEDLDTLAELARAHEAVVEAAMTHGDVVPFRMCTIYETGDAVRAALAGEANRFAEMLGRLHDTAEWSVKAFVQAPETAAASAPPASGIAYLASRRAQREAAESSRETLVDAVAELHATLADDALAAVLSRPQDRRLTGRNEEMLLNGAYLLGRESQDEFVRRLKALGRRYAERGLSVEVSGPWPPYHFVTEVVA